MSGSPVYYALIIAALLAFRVAWQMKQRREKRPQIAAS